MASEARLVLASASPRRQEILRAAGLEFTVRPSGVEERPEPGERPEDYVRRLARDKAAAVPRAAGDAVLGADTVVVVDGQILEKPRDVADAARMLRLLSGRTHQVITGVCLISASGEATAFETTLVRFVELSDAEIDNYSRSGEPMDKAGAYAIQGLASKFIDRVEGCYFNVVGLPVAAVYRLWKRMRAETGRGSPELP